MALPTYRSFDEATPEDLRPAVEALGPYNAALPDRVLAHLRLLAGDHGGLPVDRLTHSLQTAARAERAGRGDEYVFCALLHDIGDTLGAYDHAAVAAAIVKPFVSADMLWLVEQHAVFQTYHYAHKIGGERDARNEFLGHPMFDATAEFCADFDQTSFDASYRTPPLEHYVPLVRAVMATPLHIPAGEPVARGTS